MGIAWRMERLGEVDSTNRVAAERIFAVWDRGEAAEGMAVVAEGQSAGRGQHGRKWESPSGGLYLSAVVENVPEEARDRLALVAGLAVARAIRAGGVGVMIRWPNDLVIGGKKVAGILCEAVARGARWAAVIGIGVNVTTDVETLPAELRGRATALAEHVKKGAQDGNPGLLEGGWLAGEILDQISQQWAVLWHGGLTAVIEKIQPLDALRGKRVRFSSGGNTFEAVAHGVSPDGHLVLSRDGGLPEPFAVGTVLAVLD
jgi:BirA family biotin operon repressor/biotin-[acetyl-CoA-carboxylase] ligase